MNNLRVGGWERRTDEGGAGGRERMGGKRNYVSIKEKMKLNKVSGAWPKRTRLKVSKFRYISASRLRFSPPWLQSVSRAIFLTPPSHFPFYLKYFYSASFYFSVSSCIRGAPPMPFSCLLLMVLIGLPSGWRDDDGGGLCQSKAQFNFPDDIRLLLPAIEV